MNGFRTSVLAMAIVLAINTFASLASAQCGARQVDTTNLNLGLQAAPVTVQGGGCANGQCSAAASTQAFAPTVTPQSFVYTQPQTSVMVNTPRVAVNVGVQRAYQPLYVVTPPTAIVAQAAPVTQFALVSALQAPAAASASASAGASASAATSADASFGAQVLAFDPSVQVSTVSACGSGGCGRKGLFQRLRLPRRSVSVARSRSVTVN